MFPQFDSPNPQLRYRVMQGAAFLLIVLLLLGCGVHALAQAPPPDDIAMRNRAFLLCKQTNYAEALPLLEKLAVAHPSDYVILEALGSVLVGTSTDSPDPAVRKQVVLRARSVFLRAKELGDKSDYLATELEQLPIDGELTPFSVRKEVDEAMREGETAFGHSNFPAALAAYKRALQLDPKTYAAALFTGDIYFRMNQMDNAGDWFAKAIGINPDRETAYRYWGDALLKDGKMAEAKAKFIEAVVNEPYQHASWNGLHNWARANQAIISHPQIDSPNAVSGEGKQINITIGANSLGKKDGSEAWLVYSMSRALWRGDKFTQAFPNEKTYRHSLLEEVDALNTAAAVLGENYKKPKQRKNLQPSLLTLLELHDKDMIEPFVLISKPDAGTAQDYADYRKDHRDKLREYISEWVIKPASEPPSGPHAFSCLGCIPPAAAIPFHEQNPPQGKPPAGAHGCSCPSSIGASAGDPSLATLPPQNNQPGIVACGSLEERKMDGTVRATEFDVFQCGAEQPILEFDALQRAEIMVQKNSLEITETTDWPFGSHWEWVEVPFKFFVVKPGATPLVSQKVILSPPKLSHKSIDEALQQFEKMRQTKTKTASEEEAGELIGRILAVALTGNSAGLYDLEHMEDALRAMLDGAVSEGYCQAINVYNTYSKETGKVPPLQ